MRILLINYEYPPVGGGAGRVTRAIGRELSKLGHEIVVMTGKFGKLPRTNQEDGMIVRRIPCLRGTADHSNIFEMASFLAAGLASAPAIIRENQIEAAIAFFSIPGGPIGLLGNWICHVPYLVSLHGGDVPGTETSLDWLHPLLRPLRSVVLKNSLGIVAVSEFLKEMAEAADPFPVKVIPNGVDANFFVPAGSTTSEPGPFRIMFAGRFQKQKNLPFLLGQVAKLGPGKIHLELVGEGPERRSLEILAQKLNLDRAITWHGWLPPESLRDVYQSSDCFVNVSVYEGMSMAILEAMASGLPVVASSANANPQLFQENGTALLFDLGNPESFGDAIERLIEDRAFGKDLGRRARDHVVANFSWTKVAKAYLQLLQSN